MKRICLAIAALAAALVLPVSPSHAAEGLASWCAQGRDGAPQCTYFMIQHCLSATSGTAADCRIGRGTYLTVTPVSEAVVFLMDDEIIRPLCAQVEGGSECMFFTLAQCMETMQGSAQCTVKEPVYLVSARLEAMARAAGH
jgi:hypothetical protein